PRRRHRSVARADPHVPGAALPERRPRDRRAGRDDAGRGLRLRRDRRRDARSQPDDGKLSARVLRVRPPSRSSRGGEGARMSTVTTTDLAGAVEDAAAHLYVWALKDIPQDLRDALAAARDKETSTTGRRVLDVIHRNVTIADEEKNLVCQDTGIAVYTCR